MTYRGIEGLEIDPCYVASHRRLSASATDTTQDSVSSNVPGLSPSFSAERSRGRRVNVRRRPRAFTGPHTSRVGRDPDPTLRSLRTPTVEATLETSGRIRTSPCLLRGGNIAVGSEDGVLHLFDPDRPSKDRETRKFPTGDPIRSELLELHDGRVAFMNGRGFHILDVSGRRPTEFLPTPFTLGAPEWFGTTMGELTEGVIAIRSTDRLCLFSTVPKLTQLELRLKERGFRVLSDPIVLRDGRIGFAAEFQDDYDVICFIGPVSSHEPHALMLRQIPSSEKSIIIPRHLLPPTELKDGRIAQSTGAALHIANPRDGRSVVIHGVNAATSSIELWDGRIALGSKGHGLCIFDPVRPDEPAIATDTMLDPTVRLGDWSTGAPVQLRDGRLAFVSYTGELCIAELQESRFSWLQRVWKDPTPALVATKLGVRGTVSSCLCLLPSGRIAFQGEDAKVYVVRYAEKVRRT